MKEILDAYAAGAIDVNGAREKLLRLFYEHGDEFQFDLHRHERLGFPEVVFAEGKSIEQILTISTMVLEKSPAVFVSHMLPEQEEALRTAFAQYRIETSCRFMAIGKPRENGEPGAVGIITAGTSDIPFARECGLILEFLGIRVLNSFDAGVAGIHRPFMTLAKMEDADVLIVFAGMEGALPTLIASVTDKPVIAVPTPIGYGVGGKGIGAMISMLQTCAPGVTVVNIGNTVGATAGAIRILRAIKKGRA
jgi:hypothetical protein